MLKHKKIFCLLVVLMLLLCGCSKVKFTTGFKKNEFAKSGNYKMTISLTELLLGEKKAIYETLFNQSIWDEKVGETTMDNNVKAMVKDNVRDIIYLRQIADEMNIALTDDENAKIDSATREYLKTLEKEIDEDVVKELYQYFLIAEKTFYAITENVDKEVSIDDARTISVQYIYLKFVDDIEKREKEKTAKTIMSEIEAGSDILMLAEKYSDDVNHTKELVRGSTEDIAFENAAYALEMGETSGIVESNSGYYIVKCINDNIETDIEKRKDDIVFSRRKELFTDYYTEFIRGKEITFNDRYWDKISLKEITVLSGRLIEIFNKYFNY